MGGLNPKATYLFFWKLYSQRIELVQSLWTASELSSRSIIFMKRVRKLFTEQWFYKLEWIDFRQLPNEEYGYWHRDMSRHVSETSVAHELVANSCQVDRWVWVRNTIYAVYPICCMWSLHHFIVTSKNFPEDEISVMNFGICGEFEKSFLYMAAAHDFSENVRSCSEIWMNECHPHFCFQIICN